MTGDCKPCLPPNLAGSGEDGDVALARLCKALAHPARIAILRRLLAADTCVFGDVAAVTGLAPSTAVQHLTVLRDAGLVRQWNDGRRSCYCVDRSAAERFLALVGTLRLAITERRSSGC